MKSHWNYQVMGEVYGPVDHKELQELAATHVINRDTFVRRDDGDWITADRVEGLLHRWHSVPTESRR